MEYWFDSSDRIASVDENWSVFACENGAASLTPDAVCGLHLNNFISDPTTRQIWELILRSARKGNPVGVSIRCDSPDRRRRISLRASFEGDLTRVNSTLISEEFRPPIHLLENNGINGSGSLIACSWCKQFQLTPDAWVEVEELLNTLNLFDKPVLPIVSHGICPSCLNALTAYAKP